MTKGTFRMFYVRILTPHDHVHIHVGGEMGDITRSPRDVLFWLHHNFLDKVWHDWSVAHPGQFPDDGMMPETSVNARLMPTDLFTHTSRQVFSISDLGYSYK